ncbi:MAG TPA: PP2C family protein-serine/threonine phosphatase [Thermoanaerobaculia bacterium]|nr:PP2C family protein-serine/threonine phosphatase [Thermoanaerobaculia bacterium]
MPAPTLSTTLSPALRATLRADLVPFAFGVLILGLACAGLALLALGRRRDERSQGLVPFILLSALYGARLLAGSFAARLLFGLTPFAQSTVIAIITYLVGIPFLLFFDALLPARWHRLMRALAGIAAAFALVVIPVEALRRSPGAFAPIGSVVVLATVLVLLVPLLRPGEPAGWELWRLRLSFLVLALFVLPENLRGLGLLPWPAGIEPLGFLLFFTGLGSIVARRVFLGETRLADVRRELETARRIQTSILPRELPRLPGLDLAVRYLPAEDVAGDFYDFLPGPGRSLGVLVADVSGHGVPAALIASMLKVAVAAQAEHVASPARVLTGINRIFHGQLDRQFITAVYLFVDLAAGRLTWANAGHPPPLLESAAGTPEITELGPTGTVLGRLSRAAYTEASLPFSPGDRVVVFTDGIPEAPARTGGELFGDERLSAFLAEHRGQAPEALATALLERLASWSGVAVGDGQADDVTLVVLAAGEAG